MPLPKIPLEEWDFRSIPANELFAVTKYEYFRSSQKCEAADAWLNQPVPVVFGSLGIELAKMYPNQLLPDKTIREALADANGLPEAPRLLPKGEMGPLGPFTASRPHFIMASQQAAESALDVARVVEKGATLPSTRFKIHRELLDEGFTMYGMSCPVLPVPDFRALAERIADEIQPDRLERVWCEVINRRGDSFIRTIAALRAAGLDDQAHRLAEMNRSEILWELEYNRRAFLGFREVMPAGKLAFLSYTTPSSESWWSQYATDGAVLL